MVICHTIMENPWDGIFSDLSKRQLVPGFCLVNRVRYFCSFSVISPAIVVDIAHQKVSPTMLV